MIEIRLAAVDPSGANLPARAWHCLTPEERVRAGQFRRPSDRVHFAEIIEAELIGLHEGNFARYRIRPSEFAAWRQVWEAR